MGEGGMIGDRERLAAAEARIAELEAALREAAQGHRLTGETLICCDHAMVATAQCWHGGDGIASLADLIDSYSSPSS
jgi:hypothetical protein